MTTPNPISEILEALENNPELEEALRQRILTRELLALPEQVAQLTATVADMARVFEQRLAALEAKQDAADARLDGIDTHLDTMQGQLNNITGTDYERRAIRRAPRLVRRHLGIQNAEVLVALNRQNGRTITDLIDEATQAGAITEDDADDLDRADIILQGNSPDGDSVYVVAEVSITVDDTDVDRARQRARILNHASGAATHAAVIGTSISDANRERALSSHVTFIDLID